MGLARIDCGAAVNSGTAGLGCRKSPNAHCLFQQPQGHSARLFIAAKLTAAEAAGTMEFMVALKMRDLPGFAGPHCQGRDHFARRNGPRSIIR